MRPHEAALEKISLRSAKPGTKVSREVNYAMLAVCTTIESTWRPVHTVFPGKPILSYEVTH